ncbi:acetoin reductase family protein [Fistulina hepatica ATCC 64428]|uniref:Acetoin reductase family protein n=1 Tax=Fistulina hepatica ATCC 64428 TaxID=1128425 RepID=A0A0D7A6W2_9AGAR|nr:acetoin reductase family protein [Fistulina hepatica ATCC 64428]
MSSNNPFRNAVVTGAGVGLGNAIARRLAQNGLNVVVNDLPIKKTEIDQLVTDIKAAGGKAMPFTGDVTVLKNVEDLVAECVKVYGSLDVMVANAGTATVKPILESTYEDVQALFNINLQAAWNSYQTAARQMIKQGHGGRIIGAASAVAKKGYPFMSVYSATKFAIRGLTQSAAQEWGAYDVTVNTYCPGIVWTPLIESLGASLGTVVGQADVNPREMWAKSCALGRIGDPKDIAGIVSWLASPDSGFITGQSILVDGGSLFD